MGKKDFGVNTKKEEARDRKDTQKKDKQAAEEKKKEDSKWADDDKKIAKKDAKDVGFCVKFQKEEREKEAAKQRAKEEKKALLEAEEAEISKSTFFVSPRKSPTNCREENQVRGGPVQREIGGDGREEGYSQPSRGCWSHQR